MEAKVSKIKSKSEPMKEFLTLFNRGAHFTDLNSKEYSSSFITS